jgi:hypothetical protein
MVCMKLLGYGAAICANVGVLMGISMEAARAISIVPTNDGNELANAILGEGITLISSSIAYTGAATAAGIFSDGLASGIGIDRGILLTTGIATNAIGPNDSPGLGSLHGLPGDSDLNALVPGLTTHDAASLSFDFEVAGGDFFFKYVFASEEYNEFVGSKFNDVFGFFLDGQNLALLPNSTTPVSTNTVNPTQNSEFFVNNAASTPAFDIQYDGFTTVLTAQFRGLTAGKHSLKLAIADVSDFRVDSAVFIQAGTLSAVKVVSTPEPGLILGLLAAGIGGSIGLKRGKVEG